MATIQGRRRGRELTYEGNDDAITVNFPLVFDVRDDSGTLQESDILELPDLPKINQIVTVPGSRIPVACKRKRAVEEVGKKGYWVVTCDCDNLPGKASQALGTGGSQDDPADPTAWQVLADISFETTELAVETDVFGNPVQNLAKRPYAEPVVEKRLIPVLTFTQYESSTTDLRGIYLRNDSVNDSVYANGAKGGWKLTVEDADLVYKNGVYCWRVDYKLRYFEKVVTNLANAGQLLTIDRGANVIDIGNSDLIYQSQGEKVVGGWNPIRPQLDYIDVNGDPIVDSKNNQILGKMDTSGVKASGATQGSALTYWILHQTSQYLDFSSFLRIQGA